MRSRGCHDRLRYRWGWTAWALVWAALAGAAGAQTDGTHKEGSRSAVREAARKARLKQFNAGRGAGAAGLVAARAQHQTMLGEPVGVSERTAPRASILSAPWTEVGPLQVSTAEFGKVTGRVTAVAIDPADTTGNTVYLGTTGGGVWKSTNAAGAAAAVTFAPLTDVLPVFNAGAGSSVIPSLSIGSVAVGNGVVLAGTGDPNDATDSYYGEGILRSVDGGATWTLVQQSQDGAAGQHLFTGLSVAGIAFSTATPTLVVAALTQAAEGALVNAPDQTSSVKGLYYSSDAGVTWHLATVMDGTQIVQTAGQGNSAATAVVWNPVRQMFIAALQFHGYYGSVDGITWTRLAHQPGTGLTMTACPTNAGQGSPGCPLFRGALAVQAVTGDTFALTVDLANRDQGLYQDACALSGRACANAAITFGTALDATAIEMGNRSSVVAQADYNLALASVPRGTDTALYVGVIDLYRCTLAAGCTLRNTTNAENGCTNPAGVAPAQHAIAALGSLVYVGNDGGIWRSTDGVSETGPACSVGDAGHFDNLNGALGSLAEVIDFAESPTDAGTLLTGLGALGTAGTSTVTNSWTQVATGEGGTVAIDAVDASLRYVSTGAGVSIARCSKGAACGVADFASTVIGPVQVGNDVAAIHAPWLLDPGLHTNVLVGTCRVWRGPATGGALWSSANAISRPFGSTTATACNSTSPVVRSLAVGGAAGGGSNAQNAGSEVIYAGLAGALDGGQGLGGHLFVTTAAQLASNATAWTDAAKSTVTNDVANAGKFNPGGFDVSSVAVDPHDATGATVYATVMGFAGNAISTDHVYRSVDAGGHWLNISSNLPNAPANSVVVDPNDANTVYVALDTGVYVTTQVTTCASTNCWSVYGTSLPNAPIVKLAADAGLPTGDGRKGELRAATYGRGIWQVPLLTAASPAAPVIALSPTTVTYSAQAVGTASAYVTVTVTNVGNAALHVSSVTTTGDFNEMDTCAGQTVVQGGTCAVQVRFLPAATGSRNGLMTVYGDVAGGQATANLSGTGVAAAVVVLTPVSLVFGATNVGASSAQQNIAISNTGGSAVSLQTPAITGDFVISANTCGSSLSPQTGCTVGIVFAPTASGARSGTLTVVDGAGTQVASLAGTGTNPATDGLSTAALSFAPQQLNTGSAAQVVTITNAGDVALTLIAAQITSGDFTVVNGCGASLNAHASCAISVSYVPKSVGAVTGVLTIADQYRAQTVALSGVGLAPPGVSLSPVGGLGFGVVGVGLSSAAQTITLTNNGGVPLLLSGVTASGDFAIAAGTNTCGTSVSPAAVCTLGLVFAPSVAGMRTGTVTFSDNAANSPQTMQLAGTGVDFGLGLNGPSSMTIASGGTATYQLLLTSAAGSPGNAGFTCSGVPLHSLCTVNPANAALGGNTNVTVTIATGLATAAVEMPRMPWTTRVVWAAMLLPVGLCLRKRRPALFVTVLVLAGLCSCSAGRTLPATTGGGGSAVVITPAGSYTIVVAGSSAGLVRVVNLTLVVQ